jgi:hypothetical protein
MKHSFEELEALNQLTFEFKDQFENLPVGIDPELFEAYEDVMFERDQIEAELDYMIFG